MWSQLISLAHVRPAAGCRRVLGLRLVDDGEGWAIVPTAINVSLGPAASTERATLLQLVQFYVHDLSAVEGWDVDETGGFGDGLLRGCWSDPRRHPFLVRANGRLAGFAIVDQGSHLSGDPAVYDMTEFFILRRWRRSGVGRDAVRRLMQRLPGQWEVRPFPGYEPAERFWPVVCAEVAAEGVSCDTYDRHGAPATVFRLRVAA